MTKTRLEAFSDGVIAIIITIMVLELRPPHDPSLTALYNLKSKFLSYLLSFAFLGIYWNNHHHMLHTLKRVNGAILWANLHLLFWLSLIPFATAWMGETHGAPIPTAVYGVNLLMGALAYFTLQGVIIRDQGDHSALAHAVGKDFKGRVSLALYILSIPVSLALPAAAIAAYVIVSVMWVIPDRRIERRLGQTE